MALLVSKGNIPVWGPVGLKPIVAPGWPVKALIMWGALGGAGSAHGAPLAFSLGLAAGPTQRKTIAVAAEDAVNPSATQRRVMDLAFTMLGNATVTESGQADVASFDALGFTLDILTNYGFGIRPHYLALGGSDLTDVFVGSFASPSAPGDLDITTVPFRPDFVLMGSGARAVGGNTRGLSFSLGMFAGPLQRGSSSYASKDNANPSVVASYQRADRAFVKLKTTADGIREEADLVDFLDNGFRLHYYVAGGAGDDNIFIALKGGQYWVGPETQRASVGNKRKAGLVFQPAGLFAFGTNRLPSNVVDDTVGKLTVGGTDGVSLGSAWVGERDAVAPTDTEGASPATVGGNVPTAFLHHGSVPNIIDAEVGAVSLDAVDPKTGGGFTLNWTLADAVAREFIVVAFGTGVPPAPPAPPPAIVSLPRASHALEIAWNAYNLGIFTFDTSTFDGVDTFGVSPFDTRFTGPYDDMSVLFKGAGINRGRNNTRDSVIVGGAKIDVRDPQGLLNPENTGSPLAGQLQDRLHPIRLRSTYAGVTYGRFYGWVRRAVWQPTGRKGVAQLECVDLLWWLDRANPVIAATGVTTTGAAIGKVLDAIGWVDPTGRSLNTGDTIPNFVADGTKTALQLIEELLTAERGVFFIDGSGIATYRDRLSRLKKSSLATIVNTMTLVAPGVDFENTRSRVTVTRTQNSFQAIAVDDAVRRKVGYADETINTAYLSSDTQATDLSNWLLNQLKDPRPPIYDMTIDNREAALLTQILARELTDQITISALNGQVAGDFHIDAIDETIDQNRHTMKWLLSKAAVGVPIIFDTSTFGGEGVFVY